MPPVRATGSPPRCSGDGVPIVDFLVGAQPGAARRRRLHRAAGAGRADARGDAAAAARLLPRLGLAAGRGAARARPGRAVRLRLPRPADARRRTRPTGIDRGLHRPARLGRGLHPRRRLDRPRPDVRRCSPARATSRCPRRRTRRAPRRSPAATDPCEVDARLRQHRPPHPRGPAGHPAVHAGAVASGSTRSATLVDERLARRRRTADDGRRADVRLRRRHGVARVDRRRRRPGQARAGHRARAAGCATAGRPAGSCTAARASGIPENRCPAGRSASTGGPTARRCGPTRACSTTRGPRARAKPAPGRRASPPRSSAALGAPPACCLPAYEDPLAALLDEVRLPDGPAARGDVDPADARLPGPNARLAVVERLDAAAGEPAGWVLPLHRHRATAPAGPRRAGGSAAAASSCCPATSPARAAAAAELDRLGAAAGHVRSASAFEPSCRRWPARWRCCPARRPSRCPVEDAPTTALRRRGARRPRLRLPAAAGASSRTRSSCVAAVEFAAHQVGCPVVLEGYPPPGDPRLRTLVVTPDPGVIEVNVQPSASLARARRRRPRPLDEDARARAARRPRRSRSTAATPAPAAATTSPSAAPTPADSPLLRRPDLLVSLLTYWQHHPSLSYLFSGRFIGPTSQAPRVDEGRTRRSYELEIAFAELARLGDDGTALARRPAAAAPAHRHHRQHPPRRVLHRQAVQPRLRARPARAARAARLRDAAAPADGARPGAARPRRWSRGSGTSRTRRRWCAGAPSCTTGSCCPTSSRPTSPTSSPTCARTASRSSPAGSTRSSSSASRGSGRSTSRASASSCARPSSRGTCSARRSPAGGTARYVDSSVERLQVAADGLVPARHVVTCNGVPVPLRADRTARAVRWPACASGPGSRRRPCTPRSASTARCVFDVVDRGERPVARRLHLPRGPPGRPRPTTRSRSTPTRRRRAARAGSRPRATPRAPSTSTPHRRARATAVRDGRRVPAHPRPAAASSRHDVADHTGPGTGRWAPYLDRMRAADVPDELVDATARSRPAWSEVAERRRDRSASTGCWRAASEGRRLLEDDGVTYLVSGEDRRRRAAGRSTRCRWCSARTSGPGCRGGLIQRAELLDLVLTDLYGPRRLRPLGPAAGRAGASGTRSTSAAPTASGCPGRASCSSPPPTSPATPTAPWRVLGDRTQAPSGLGFAMENRRVVSRVVPDLYRTTRMQRLSPFFQTLRLALQAVAPARERDAPGRPAQPRARTARPPSTRPSSPPCSAIPLVEGTDLTVRDGRVWLRALGRLEPVDVILRRVDCSWCDPLELRPDSQLGVPGLLEAARRGTRLGGQHHRQRGAREPGSAAVPACAGARAARRGPRCCPRSTPGGAATPSPASTSSRTSTGWCSGRCRAARAGAGSASC